MKYKIVWSGLADDRYYEVIAKFCLPSWNKLPGEKNIITDSDRIVFPFINITPWNTVENRNSKFLLKKPSKKTWSFWRKMQSQVWAARNYKLDYDFVILLDTDIEILDSFDLIKLEDELEKFLKSGFVWATGRSQSRLHDSGFIILNTKHQLYDKVMNDYENIWETEKISQLRKPYDGIAVESMFDDYPSYKVSNIDYGKGFHVYDIGLVHYGSKIPKKIRIESQESGRKIVEEYTKDIVVKQYKC